MSNELVARAPRNKYYIIKDGAVVPAASIMEWGAWFGSSGTDRSIAKTKINESLVSTVFLGLDHNYDPDGPPLIYETMCAVVRLAYDKVI